MLHILFIFFSICFSVKAQTDVQPKLIIHPWGSVQKNDLISKLLTDAKDGIVEYETESDVKPADLRKYGIVKTKFPKSFIVNNELAAKLHNDSLPPLENEKTPSFSAREFTQVNFEDAECEDDPSQWQPLGPLRKNEASGTASYSQSWSMGVSTTDSKAIFLTVWLWAPKLSSGVSYGTSNGGSISCNIPANGELQFQVKVRSIRIRGIKERALNVVEDFFKSKLKIGDYVQRHPSIVAMGHDVETACVTDSEYFIHSE